MDGDVVAALQAWDDARAGLAALPLNTLNARELLAVYERRQHAHRQDAAKQEFFDDHDADQHEQGPPGRRRVGREDLMDALDAERDGRPEDRE